jgi:hypothetical protein
MVKVVTMLQSLAAIPGRRRRCLAQQRFNVMATLVEDLVARAGFSAQTLLVCFLDKLLSDEDDDDDINADATYLMLH